MRIFPFAALLAAAAPAWGQAALPDEPAAPAWTATLAGGVSRLGPDLDQSFVGATLGRSFGRSYVRAGVTGFGGDDGAGRLRTSAESVVVSLAYGREIGPVTIEVQGAIGDRSFEDVRLTLGSGQTVTVGGDGDLWSLGASISAVLPIGRGWTLIPYAFVEQASLDVARPIIGPRGRPGANPFVEEQEGTTGSVGLALDRAIGSRSSLGASAAFVTTSNAAAVTRIGGTTTGGQRLLEGAGFSDSWAELGGQATIGLGPRLALDLAVIHSLGLAGGETVTGSAGLRLSF